MHKSPTGHERKRLEKAVRNGIHLSREDDDGLHSKTDDANNLPYWQDEREKARLDTSEESFARFRHCDKMVRRICLDSSTEFVEGEPDALLGNILHEASGLPAEE